METWLQVVENTHVKEVILENILYAAGEKKKIKTWREESIISWSYLITIGKF